MATAHQISPIFSVRDVDAALDFYRRLGFTVRPYPGGGYGFAMRDGIELHLGEPGPGGEQHPVSAYLFVDDADELAAEWLAAGADVRQPEDTEWKQHEGVLIDPDGNIIRFGSPVREGS
jgi:uncharacterized glyoxalase superfamily protein PhnB